MTRTGVSRQEAEQLLQRAHDDPALLARLRAAYGGRHDVLDALWWAAHPLTATPGGLPDPADGLRNLQRAVFSRSASQPSIVEAADPDGDGTQQRRAAEYQLQEQQRLLAEDVSLLEQAWDVIHPVATVPPADVVEDAAAEVGTPPAPRRKLLFQALAGVALLAAIVGLPTLTGVDADAESEPAPTPTTPASTPHARTDIVSFVADANVSDPQAVLARPAVNADQPRFEPAGSFEPGSFRRLPDLVGYLELYLARGEEADSVCLVVMRHNGTGQSSCVGPAAFAQHGIELGASGDRYQVGVDVTILSESFTLLASGDFHYEARARVPGVQQELP